MSPHKFAIFAICDIFPLASFTATIFSILDSSTYQKMSCYPEDGVKIIDGVVVVKFAKEN